jgi:hypothetical protein
VLEGSILARRTGTIDDRFDKCLFKEPGMATHRHHLKNKIDQVANQCSKHVGHFWEAGADHLSQASKKFLFGVTRRNQVHPLSRKSEASEGCAQRSQC